MEEKMADRLITPVYAIATHAASALGLDTAAHWQRIIQLKGAIQQHTDAAFSQTPFWASKLDPLQWQIIRNHAGSGTSLSPLEQLALFSIRNALDQLEDSLDANETILILSSTKGNIEWLNEKDNDRLLLGTSANLIAQELGLKHTPIVVSQACISGVVATLLAQRLLQAGKYRQAIVTGVDRFSKFVLNGFQSFHAIADAPCRPFDKNRSGINLGEAAGTIILSTQPTHPLAQLLSGSSTNDANHISGPSRTGEELALAIQQSLWAAGLQPNDIDLISAHGTATLYNDEMESKAFGIAGVANAPVHSIKGFTGHTLGAAGVLETILLIEALRHQLLIPSLGYQEVGTSQALTIPTTAQPATLTHALKTASGFGGCNAATIWKKV